MNHLPVLKEYETELLKHTQITELEELFKNLSLKISECKVMRNEKFEKIFQQEPGQELNYLHRIEIRTSTSIISVSPEGKSYANLLSWDVKFNTNSPVNTTKRETLVSSFIVLFEMREKTWSFMLTRSFRNQKYLSSIKSFDKKSEGDKADLFKKLASGIYIFQ